MANPEASWFLMNTEQRRQEIHLRRSNDESFAKIALDLLGSEKNKPTVWSWAKRNMEDSEIYPKMKQFSREPYGTYSDIERWIMYDIISSLFPRLDAMSQHLLVELEKNLSDQHKNFTMTAGFLDNLESRIIEALKRNTAVMAMRSSTTIGVPPTPPLVNITSAPPPPSDVRLPSQDGVTPGPISELRTDFEEMTMEEIILLPPEFLDALPPVDRNRLQNRVKELKKIAKMSPDEKDAYLKKKKEEKTRSEAVEGLGSSLTTMLDDSDSLFARMRRAADDSQVSGTGTFGKFTVEYTFFYCFACGKMNRSEDDSLDQCEYCGAGEDHMVLDEAKTDYRYWECLFTKKQEHVDIDYSRGKQIVVRSRWKTLVDDPQTTGECPPNSVREITNAVHVKADPDKSFSHYLTLLRMYTQLHLQGDLKTYLTELAQEIQKLPDITSIDSANSEAIAILKKISFLLEWIETQQSINSVPSSDEIKIQVTNLVQDLRLLQDSESPQELHKASEIGQVVSKIDQILNRFTSIFFQLESELLLPSRWKCSSCDDVFEVKDRLNIPEKCSKCGKIITKLTIIEE